MTLAVVLLAAGQGTRMQSKQQKILHEVGGRPMVLHAFLAAESVADSEPVVVVAPGEQGIRALIGTRALYAEQPSPMGTGHAAQMAAPLLVDRAEQVIITYADMPLLRAQTMAQLAALQSETGAAVALLTAMGEPDSPFGRVVRGDDGGVVEIVEVAEARLRPNTDELLAIRELNAGVYCFDAGWLWLNIAELPLRQARRGMEYYLTDTIEIAARQGRQAVALSLADPDEGLGAGTRAEMVGVEKAFQRRVNNHWLNSGVTLIDPDATYIGPDVTIGQDTVIRPGTHLQGRTAIGADCDIGPNSIIRDTRLGDGCRVEQAVVEDCELPPASMIGPFQHRRGG